jgi:hypothetical protein
MVQPAKPADLSRLFVVFMVRVYGFSSTDFAGRSRQKTATKGRSDILMRQDL